MKRRLEKLEAVAAAAKVARELQKRFFRGERDLMPAARDAERALDRKLEELDDSQGKLFE